LTTPRSGLLPEGLRDVRPPHADAEAALLRALVDAIGAQGYARVSPPLVEFEDSLVGRMSAEKARDLFRFMDPLSGRTLALRADITPQIARIASHAMAKEARPLRLAYGGAVVRVQGSMLAPERQSWQVGAELIGSDSAAAAAEVIALAVEALEGAGFGGLSVDLTMPASVARLAQGLTDKQLDALDAKDSGALPPELQSLVRAAGPVEAALAALEGGPLAQDAERLRPVVDLLRGANVTLTLDPVERQGFAYQSWIGFSLFVAGARVEVGRGGSYAIVHPDGRTEAAVGFSLYLDALVDLAAPPASRPRVALPYATPATVGRALRQQGYVTVAALTPGEAPIGCTHMWDGQAPRLLTTKD
jgi:ATP phosphoribosyltransferase regulatory subunit